MADLVKVFVTSQLAAAVAPLLNVRPAELVLLTPTTPECSCRSTSPDTPTPPTECRTTTSTTTRSAPSAGRRVLRCLRYMSDVESHTICYLRDLLVTPSHRTPKITAFLTMWAYEEFWHGEALDKVLRAHGMPATYGHIRRRTAGARPSRPARPDPPGDRGRTASATTSSPYT